MTYTTVQQTIVDSSAQDIMVSPHENSQSPLSINLKLTTTNDADSPVVETKDTTTLNKTEPSHKSTKDKKDEFKSRYTSTKRKQEYISVVLFYILLAVSVQKFISWYFLKNIWIFLTSSVVAMFAADFFSGIVHWAADTWGSLETPLVGNSFIRSFREHHVMPTAMTAHDYVETNGDNCMLTIPVLAFTAFSTISSENSYELFLLTFLVKLCFWVSLTNQIHKWSHTYRCPAFVAVLQKYGIILSKRDHAVHHRNPFDKYYCITNGWLNPWLASIGFWKRLEDCVTILTGYQPRSDDQAWTMN